MDKHRPKKARWRWKENLGDGNALWTALLVPILRHFSKKWQGPHSETADNQADIKFPYPKLKLKIGKGLMKDEH